MNEQAMLFASLPESAAVSEPSATAEPAPRVLLAERNQIELRAVDLEATICLDHPARNVWAFVERLDLSALYGEIGSVEGRAGRPAIDPRILMALWLYATVDGVGNAREIERLTQAHDAYRWICGGVNVNHHTLSDFRCARLELLDGWLTHSVAVSSQSSLAWQSGPLSAAVFYDNYNRKPVLAENWPSFWKPDNSNRVHGILYNSRLEDCSKSLATSCVHSWKSLLSVTFLISSSSSPGFGTSCSKTRSGAPNEP